MLEEADYGMTDMALGRNPSNVGDETLLVRFFKHPKQNVDKSEAEGRPIFEEVDYVEIITPGNKDNIISRPASEIDLRRFPRQYQAYKARVSQNVVEGTPLAEWPGISRSLVEELKFSHIHTVEQLLAVSDADAQKFQGLHLIKDKARAFLDKAKGENKEVEALKAQNADLLARLERLEAHKQAAEPSGLEQLLARNAETAPPADDLRGPDAPTTPRRRQRAPE